MWLYRGVTKGGVKDLMKYIQFTVPRSKILNMFKKLLASFFFYLKFILKKKENTFNIFCVVFFHIYYNINIVKGKAE